MKATEILTLLSSAQTAQLLRHICQPPAQTEHTVVSWWNSGLWGGQRASLEKDGPNDEKEGCPVARKTNHTDFWILPTVCPAQRVTDWQASQSQLMKESENITDETFSKSHCYTHSGTPSACQRGWHTFGLVSSGSVCETTLAFSPNSFSWGYLEVLLSRLLKTTFLPG